MAVGVGAAALSGDESVSTSLVIINGFLVFFMQVGFLALETGSGRAKNVRNVLIKNLLDVMLAALVWWAVGFAFAYGKTAGGVIGTTQFFYEGEQLYDKSVRPWFFSWTFCIAACTIISGCLAERTALAAYPAATLLIAAVVHPLLVHWIWNPQGFFNNLHECNVLDFAGGMVVHMLGGLFGLVGAYMCGPRLGRFEQLTQDDDLEGSYAGQADARGVSGDMVDSASELAGSSGPAEPQAAAAAGSDGVVSPERDQQLHQQQQQPAGLSGSRSLHTLLPSVPSSSSGGVAIELGRPPLGQFKQRPPVDSGGATASSSGRGTMQAEVSPAGTSEALQQQQRQIADAATEHAGSSSSSSRCWGKWFAWPGHRQQQQQQRRRQRPLHDITGTSAGSCGRGICKYVPKTMPGHDMAFVTLGTFMLWFGWYGFNNGSVYMYVTGNPSPSHGTPAAAISAGAISAEVVQRTSMNTALGGASAGLTSLLCAALFWGTYDLRICCNGVLSGLVIVTCMCGFVDPWAAVVCSAIAGAVYVGGSWALLRCGVDDPLDSAAVHLFSGILGSIMLAFVAIPKHVLALTGSPCGGIFYGRSGWLQLGLQLLGICTVIVFAGGSALVLFWVLKKRGMLRVDQTTELAGIDNMEHGGPAYPEFTSGSWPGGTGASATLAVTGRRLLV